MYPTLVGAGVTSFINLTMFPKFITPGQDFLPMASTGHGIPENTRRNRNWFTRWIPQLPRPLDTSKGHCYPSPVSIVLAIIRNFESAYRKLQSQSNHFYYAAILTIGIILLSWPALTTWNA
ncbi:hypothetical protein EDB82DRAFT_514236 [Fusarium venenatum]|uniref:uncharacterized protein n=1 Tax=Fusarium venenatum TaxID=56646 RepID=UPI001D82364B|nr:hypothetical protein EDB82DRAFT_514236 [Fusarium venenatum]